ncbi:SIR2 family protein [Sphingomonas donggukensis]|uniref:SIR2 family protein n=1 Tax=Sphingomonas donggukensis TaxID=2949093 RepID=A0ABY4TVD5_9SPHN|nr:SIR2 family protein [Sphingomonas donggukensis]URW75835.1 SIR2 family protein [Sphingomonas donggukensis]
MPIHVEPNTRLAFSIAENPGVYALLLGSGVSRSAEIPTGWDVVVDLIRRIAAAEGVTEVADWGQWHRDRFGTEPSYSDLLDALSLTPAERRSVLHRYIEPSAEDLEAGRRVPTPAHHAVARLVRDGFVRVIVTTNFDRLLETALSAVGVEAAVIKSVDDLAGASPLVHGRCTIVKIHGDYLDNRILNTDGELAAYPGEYDRLLDRILDDYGLVVAGWSGDWDPGLRAAIARAPNRRYPTYWASRGGLGGPAAELLAARAGVAITVTDADTFFVRLADDVETLDKARRPAPETIELLLASTKRALSRPDMRIELGDLVAGQAEKLAARLVGDEFPVVIPPVDNAGLIERWEGLERAAEPLARMFGLMGRWGDGTEFGHAVDALRALTRARPVQGNGVLIALTGYPAYVAFLTYALGLAKAERWRDLLRWMSTEIPRPHRQLGRAVDTLFMSFWSDGETDWWKRWPGLENRKSPWADHMVDHVVPWSRDYGLTGDAQLENYDLVELLGGFAGLATTREETLEQAQEWTWMPWGQLMWSSDRRERAVARINEPALKAELLAAGFSGGSNGHWDGVLKNVELLARKVGW